MKISARILVALITITSYSNILRSQDTLYLKSGQKVASKILEVTPSEIKYKKTDNPEGPTYVTNSIDINIVKYSNGTIDTIKGQPPVNIIVKAPVIPAAPKVIDPHPPIYVTGPVFKYDGRHINARAAQEIMLKVNDPQLNQYVKTARSSKTIGMVTGFLAIPTFVFGVGYSFVALLTNSGSSTDLSYGPGIASGVVAAACLATSITFNVRKKHNMKAAVALYNEKY